MSQPPLFCAFRITALCCVLHLGFIVAHWCVHCYMNSLLISFSRWGCMNIQINPSIHVHTVTPATRSLIPSSSMQQHPQCELVWDNSSNKCFFCSFTQVNMDLWFFVLLLGSGLISVGATNVTTGKPCLLSPLFCP